MHVVAKALVWPWQHKYCLLSLITTIATQAAGRAIVGDLYSRGLWVYRSDLHFKLAQTHAAFALVAILLAFLAALKEKPQWVGIVTLTLAWVNIFGAAV